MVTALLVSTILIELALYIPVVWKIRLYIIVLLTVLLSTLTGSFLVEQPNWLGVSVAAVSVVRLFNLFRIAENRMHLVYLKRASLRTSLIFLTLQASLLLYLYNDVSAPFTTHQAITILASLQLVVALMILFITLRNIRKTSYRQGTNFYPDQDLPTVSVLIPARNETYDLEACLRSIIVNDYPKLEIIVLDDCSQLRTSEVIKKFAQDGVRFIKGSEPHTKWLAKNQAYERLRKEANGELLLFCGVDVRFGQHGIRALVTELVSRDKEMVSIMPRRLSADVKSAFIQPMRYWWELALPRKLLNKPAVLSTTWLISSRKLDELGGFASVSRSIIPERFFARELIKSNSYSFIKADDTLDIQTVKSLPEQRATAIRTKYPQLSKRPESVLGIVLLEFVVLFGPFAVLLWGVVSQDLVLIVLSGLAAITLIYTHISVVYVTNPANSIVALWNFPLVVLTEGVITLVSMIRYEFGEVTWKDRNICIPVMHVVPRLPRIQD